MTQAPNKFLIVISGPTGIGKTDLAIQLNQKLQTSIISADSRQIYKEMTIGTAKPSPEEIEKGHIKLVDHVSVTQNYSAGQFEEDALSEIYNDFKTKDYSILCGGTGLYIKAVLEGLDKYPVVDPEVVQNLQSEIENGNLAKLQTELQKTDPNYYDKIDTDNPRRILRGLSVIRSSGQAFSSLQNQKKDERKFTPIHIVLEMDRAKLYDRINRRVLKMVDRGLVEEVKTLLPHRHLRSLDTVGYAEVFKHLDGECSLEKAIENIQRNSRRYAKRQMTWSRGQTNGTYFKAGDVDGVLAFIDERS